MAVATVAAIVARVVRAGIARRVVMAASAVDTVVATVARAVRAGIDRPPPRREGGYGSGGGAPARVATAATARRVARVATARRVVRVATALVVALRREGGYGQRRPWSAPRGWRPPAARGWPT